LIATENRANSLFLSTFSTQGSYKSPEARIIHGQLQAKNLNNWGFVIYRCSYGTDQEWYRFMKIFKAQAEDAIANACGAPWLYQKLSWTVVEDRSLKGATTAQVRAAFRNWIFSPQADSEIPAALRQRVDIIPPGHTPEEARLLSRTRVAPRYQYCVQVDDIALKSILKYGEEEPYSNYHGHVNIVKVDWEIPDPNTPEHKDAEKLGYNPVDEGEPPIEGCRLYDVGWMRCDVEGMLSALYTYLVKDGNWDDWYYHRPPQVWWDGSQASDAPDDVPDPKE
jgi:hypothetical protein